MVWSLPPDLVNWPQRSLAVVRPDRRKPDVAAVRPHRQLLSEDAGSKAQEVASALVAGGVIGIVAATRRQRSYVLPRRASRSSASAPQALASFIDEVGVGNYQFQQVLLLACFFFSEAAELDVISPLTTAWRLEWALVTDQVAILASIGYLGFAAGTFLSGVLGDSLGRRVPILLGYVGVLVGSFGMWGASSPYVVGAFRALTGFSVGVGVPASLTMIAEISPGKSRATLIGLCYTAIALGALYADLGLYFYLPDLKSGDWRSLCIWSAAPAALALPLALLELEDTPVFHLMKGDLPNVSRVLAKMAERNGRPDASWQPPPAVAAGDAQQAPATKVLLNDLQASTLPLAGCAALDFAYNFVGFGCGYFFPLIISELAEGAPIPPVGELVVANLLAFPALFLAYKALDSQFGYRQILTVAGVVEICAVICLLASGVSVLPVIGIFVLKLTMTTFSQTVNTVKGELFPSLIRVSALSLSGTCGRIGALLAPAIIEETRGPVGSSGEFSSFLTVLAGVLAFATAVGVALLPETKGKTLPD